MDDINLANQRYWDSMAQDWQALRDQDQLWQKCAQDPELAFDGTALAMIKQFVGDLTGKRACIIGSGDNYVAFALAGLGARVTSTDISARQLEIASSRAKLLNLEIEFFRADASSPDGFTAGEFDLICSSNGFFVWVAEPGKVFCQVFRLLKPGGYYIFYDIHPFLRPWKDQIRPFEMVKPYSETGPFEYKGNSQKNYQFHWRISDLINPLLNAGLILRQIAESPARDSRFWEGISYLPGADLRLLDWQVNPRAGLPVWLTVAAQKPP